MLGNSPFYNGLLRRYIVVFGSLFNNIQITKSSADGTISNVVNVPLAYGPAEKYLMRLRQDPDFTKAVATQLPRMSFEIQGMTYAGDRKLNGTNQIKVPDPNNPKAILTTYTPVPYDINFQLNILVRAWDDGAQILEQILPFFQPDFTVTVRMIDEMGLTLDIPYVLNSVMNQDTYEGNFDERRALIWTLNFTCKANFYGSVTSPKIITVAEVNFWDDSNPAVGNVQMATVTVTPGQDANGNPTSNSQITVPPNSVDPDENYGFIVTIQDKGSMNGL
jgi:hypothetical protein